MIELTPDEKKLIANLRSERDKALAAPNAVGSTYAAIGMSYADQEVCIYELIRADRELKAMIEALKDA